MKSWLAGAFLLASLLLFGFIFGALVATRIMTTGGMGFDQIADALGGVMVGSLVALVVGIILIRTLSVFSRVIVALVAIVGVVGSVLYLRATPANIRVAEPVELPPPPVESFSLTLQTDDPFEGPREEDPLLPWSTLQIASNLTFSYISLDEPDALCIAPGELSTEDGIARLTELRTLLEDLSATNVPCESAPCSTCTSVGLLWYLDQDRHNIGFDAACWRNETTLQPLRESVTSIVEDYADRVICEPR